ncbi:hypothetical protein [Sphingobium baderi]|uniref:Uncharacterized protein n=1 Tax=Sphingobium baderi TaxID=1332080 RepID=A0A0S3EZT6_9SPHN|nr:hypothetical protein [Sphingobium baderi]ALR20899.1 hypothetical protein ATN00_11920 [Sphingobium baderi]
MLSAIGLVVVGFVLGVLLAGAGACLVIGVIHREAVRIVDSHMFAMAAPMVLHSAAGKATPSGSSHANQ